MARSFQDHLSAMFDVVPVFNLMTELAVLSVFSDNNKVS